MGVNLCIWIILSGRAVFLLDRETIFQTLDVPKNSLIGRNILTHLPDDVHKDLFCRFVQQGILWFARSRHQALATVDRRLWVLNDTARLGLALFVLGLTHWFGSVMTA